VENDSSTIYIACRTELKNDLCVTCEEDKEDSRKA